MDFKMDNPLTLKKKLSRYIFDLNSDALDLVNSYKKSKKGLPSKEAESESDFKIKLSELKDIVTRLELENTALDKSDFDNYLKMMKTTVETCESVLLEKEEAVDSVKKAKTMKTEAELCIKNLDSAEDTMVVKVNTENDSAIDNELAGLIKHVLSKFKRIQNELNTNMKKHIDILQTAWNEEKETLDYQGLKELRYEFDQMDKKMYNYINDWDRKKYSDILTDYLEDRHNCLYNEYLEVYTKMANEKRKESALRRKKEQEMLDYKNVKKRPVPSWPEKVPYSKFKPDLLSWDREHYLSSGSSKFGEFVEMLKKEGRLITFEQVSTRLGNSRNDKDIINKIVSLLDSMNEETCFNKLSKAWDTIVNLKKDSSETLNDFFSKFETIQYNLNLADESYKDPSGSMTIKDKELMFVRKVELNDKLKAVVLIKSLALDEGIKRDVLSKVDFNKEPSVVYETTKIAIRDILGDSDSKESNKVYISKPWHQPQQRWRSRSPSWQRRNREGSRSRSGDRQRQSSRGFGREGRSPRRDSRNVTFQRRDQTPVPGSNRDNDVFVLSIKYDEVFMNDKDFVSNKGQFMIIDIGSPRSLMGKHEYDLLRESLSEVQLKRVIERPANEKFRFGPSKVYESIMRVEVPLMVKDIEILTRFYIIEGLVPILIGNDILEPLGGVIDTENRVIDFKRLERSLNLVKTSGGHYVLPIKRRNKDKENECLKEESLSLDEETAVLLVSFAECESDEDVWRLHNLVGHEVFLNVLLDKNEEDEVMKVHRYFGHRSGRKIWELFAKAGRLEGKKKAVLNMLENCVTCKQLKKTPPRPKIGMPMANSFNEIVGLDLKIMPNGKNILWMVDLFTKVLKGKVINDKKPDTIVNAILEKWIVGEGLGPGHPSKYFYADNGGEFLNNEVINFAAAQDTIIKFTAANSPWMNGIVERHHATADTIYEKILKENPSLSAQEVVDRAAMAKNCEVGRSGFSPIQLVMGQSPCFPGLGEATQASSNFDSSSKPMKALKLIDDIRVKYRQFECDEKLKKLRSQRINPCVEKNYNMGDPVIFRDSKRKEWKQGIALVKFGKTLYLKFGNWLRRVPIDTVIPDADMAHKIEDGYIEPEEFDPDAEEQFEDGDVHIEDLEKDLEKQQLKDQINLLEEQVKKLTNERLEVDKTAEKEKNYVEKRSERRKNQKLKKAEERKRFPVLGQVIEFKDYGSENWTVGKVYRVFKKTSIHKDVKQLVLEDGSKIEKNFAEEVDEWRPFEPQTNTDSVGLDHYFLSDIINDEESSSAVHDTFKVQVINKEQYSSSEVKEAMLQEISKYRKFDAFEEVVDEGQESVPIRWVVTKQEGNGKNQPIKARMCIRGDLEKTKDSVRSDSPSAGKETLKLALMIAANEKFAVKGADIKSAYLQGQQLRRTIYVRPPVEANADGKLWLLKRAAYGVLDGGRLFYLRLLDELTKLGLHKVHSDGALFTYVQNGVLHGLVASVVDDLIIAGDDKFEIDVVNRLKEIFVFSKVEVGAFKFCGCNIKVLDDSVIELDQNDYVNNLEYLAFDDEKEDKELTVKEQKALRGKIGELLWLSLMTRPDISFDVNRLSSEVPRATGSTIKTVNNIVSKAKSKKDVIRFCKIGDISELVVKVYTDASFCNQDDKLRSTAGRVIFVENIYTEKVNLISWKTKKITRVCRSVKSAETRALEDGIGDAVNTARIIQEVYKGDINLKDPEQLPVIALVDNKSLWENLHNTRQCEEKMLRNTIASIKELIDMGMLSKVNWVPTNLQLADCLTKQGNFKTGERLLKIASGNRYL